MGCVSNTNASTLHGHDSDTGAVRGAAGRRGDPQGVRGSHRRHLRAASESAAHARRLRGGLSQFPFFCFLSWCLFQKGTSECRAITKSCCSRLRIVLNPPWCCRFPPAGENANLVSGHPDEGGLPPLGGVDLRGRVHRVPDPWLRHRQPHPHLGTCVCSSRGTGAVKTGFSVDAVCRRQQGTAHLSNLKNKSLGTCRQRRRALRPAALSLARCAMFVRGVRAGKSCLFALLFFALAVPFSACLVQRRASIPWRRRAPRVDRVPFLLPSCSSARS